MVTPNPMNDMINEITHFLTIFHENKSKKVGKIPKEVIEQLNNLEERVRIFNEVCANLTSQAGKKTAQEMTEEELRTAAHLKKLNDEAVILRETLLYLLKQAKLGASPMGPKENLSDVGKSRKTKMSRRLGYKGWKRM